MEKKTGEAYTIVEITFEPVQQFENMVRIGGPGSCNNSTSKSILDMLNKQVQTTIECRHKTSS